MIELLPDIRNTPRALITQGDKVLLLKKVSDNNKEYYSLPGGGQNNDETIKETLTRECFEEIGTSINIGDLIFITDFFRLRDTQPPTRRHLVEFIFECSISGDYEPRNGKHPDKHQKEVVWADLNEISSYPMHPHYLSDYLNQRQNKKANIYLGTFRD